MPMKTPHLCNHAGCPELTVSRYCLKHTKETQLKYNRERGSASKQGYDRAWQKVRSRYLAENPLCEECNKHGRIRAATMVHHRKEIRLGGDRLAYDNLQALCNKCHNLKHDRFKARVI